MTWDDQRVDAATAPPETNPTLDPGVTANPNGFRRAVLTAGMAVALLVTGGVAIVAAASPEPSASTAPGATSDPSSGGSTDSSRGGRQGHEGQPCPDGAGSGSDGSSGSSGGQSSDPSPSTTTPSPSTATPLT
jgi:hypothetical protein